MSDGDRQRRTDRFWPAGVPNWLRTLGMSSWMVAGVAAAVYVLSYLLATAAGIMVPLIVAVVIGVVAYPLVAALEKRHVSAWLGALLVLILLIVIIVAVAWITVAGVIGQWPQITKGVQEGIASLKTAVTSLGVNNQTVQPLVQKLQASSGSAAKSAASGIVSAVGSGLSGVFALFFGLFIGAALLYYVLSDFPTISHYIDAHLGLPADLASGVSEDAATSLRGYFQGTTVTGVAVALVIGIGVALLGVPLAVPIALVTFLTCYIPFFGAIISGAFAFLIAFGAEGFTTAVLVLAVVLVAQNLLQTVINAKAMGSSLDLHPLVVLVVTMLGGIFAGLLGAALAAPLLAMVLRAGGRISAYRLAADKAEQ